MTVLEGSDIIGALLLDDAALLQLVPAERIKAGLLPEGIALTAVAGVWGDSRNIRCLFMDQQGKGYMRNIVKWGDAGYNIRELGIDAKKIEVGQVFDL